MATGFGESKWGSYSFGGDVNSSDFSWINVFSVNENRIRLQFNREVYTDNLGSFEDGLNISKFTIEASPFSKDRRGVVPRDVLPLRAEKPGIADGLERSEVGFFIDIIMDRFLSSYPSIYSCSIQNIFSSDLVEEIESGTLLFYGMQLQEFKIDPLTPYRSRDIANRPFSGKTANEFFLGAYEIDETGDVAFEEGISNLKKRVLRRLLTKKGGFLHLPNYGVGFFDLVKTLGTSFRLNSILTEARNQLLQEPDIAQVDIKQSTPVAGLYRFLFLIQTKEGNELKFTLPVS